MRPSTIATGARIVAAGDEVPQGTLLMTRVKAGVSGCVTAVSNAGCEREAEQLVRQFHAAPPRRQAHVATTLLEFCNRQPRGSEWQDCGGRAGVVAALVSLG